MHWLCTLQSNYYEREVETFKVRNGGIELGLGLGFQALAVSFIRRWRESVRNNRRIRRTHTTLCASSDTITSSSSSSSFHNSSPLLVTENISRHRTNETITYPLLWFFFSKLLQRNTMLTCHFTSRCRCCLSTREHDSDCRIHRRTAE